MFNYQGELYGFQDYKRKKKYKIKEKDENESEKQQCKKYRTCGEITILVILTVCILLVLSNFGIGGIAGEAVSSVLFGLFGYMAYVLPFLVLRPPLFYFKQRKYTCLYKNRGRSIFVLIFDGNTGIDI
ncbi:hypothetical protein M5E84_05260 [[Ruminococcus] torques]|nr:hypothetical protein M5E84_05260 [[Ruminococcus] torques]